MTAGRDEGKSIVHTTTCIALEPVTALVLDSTVYKLSWVQEKIGFLRTVPGLCHISETKLIRLATIAISHVYSYKQKIITRGTECGQDVRIVRSGHLKCTIRWEDFYAELAKPKPNRHPQSNFNVPIEVVIMGPGDVFEALNLTEQDTGCHQMDASADSEEVVIYTIPRNDWFDSVWKSDYEQLKTSQALQRKTQVAACFQYLERESVGPPDLKSGRIEVAEDACNQKNRRAYRKSSQSLKEMVQEHQNDRMSAATRVTAFSRRRLDPRQDVDVTSNERLSQKYNDVQSAVSPSPRQRRLLSAALRARSREKSEVLSVSESPGGIRRHLGTPVTSDSLNAILADGPSLLGTQGRSFPRPHGTLSVPHKAGCKLNHQISKCTTEKPTLPLQIASADSATAQIRVDASVERAASSTAASFQPTGSPWCKQQWGTEHVALRPRPPSSSVVFTSDQTTTVTDLPFGKDFLAELQSTQQWLQRSSSLLQAPRKVVDAMAAVCSEDEVSSNRYNSDAHHHLRSSCLPQTPTRDSKACQLTPSAPFTTRFLPARPSTARPFIARPLTARPVTARVGPGQQSMRIMLAYKSPKTASQHYNCRMRPVSARVSDFANRQSPTSQTRNVQKNC